MSRKEYTEEEQKRIVSDYVTSRLSLSEYLKHDGMPTRLTFKKWIEKFQDQNGDDLKLSEKSMAVLTSDGRTKFELNSEQKYRILMETEKLDELELGKYCLENGILKAQIERWRANCMKANDTNSNEFKIKEELNQKDQEIQRLRKQLSEANIKLKESNKALDESAKTEERLKDALAEYAVREITLKKFHALFDENK